MSMFGPQVKVIGESVMTGDSKNLKVEFVADSTISGIRLRGMKFQLTPLNEDARTFCSVSLKSELEKKHHINGMQFMVPRIPFELKLYL